MVRIFVKNLRTDSRVTLNSKLFKAQSRIAKEQRLPKNKKDFTILLALKNKEHLIKTEIRNRQIKASRKSLQELKMDAKEEKDKILRKKLK